MKPDDRVLELRRRLTLDRLAVAVDAIDVVAADILLGVVLLIGERAFVDLGRNLARPVLRIVEALVADVAALRIAGEAGTIRGLDHAAMETAMEIADGDAKPSKLSTFQEDMRDGQAAVMMCVAQYIEASEPAGVKLDQMKI